MHWRHCRGATIYWITAEHIQVKPHAKNGRLSLVPGGYQIAFGPEPYHVPLISLIEGRPLWRSALQHTCKGLNNKHDPHSRHLMWLIILG
jgi:hypothetical protein